MSTKTVRTVYQQCTNRQKQSKSQWTVKKAKMTINVPVVTGLPRLYQQCTNRQQELSYRKQMARQLRTQYPEGIYDNPVTLKSRLTVIQCHWKQNHWTDHTRLTIRRVIRR